MRDDDTVEGLVFSIDRFVAEDGPGIRTTVFLKGCPLRCIWCHSPQSQAPEPQLYSYRNRCTGCGACVEACPLDAQVLSASQRSVLWEKCDDCGVCATACPSAALEICGIWMTVDAVVDVIRRDQVYYRNSGGGVTFSGGEPTAQPDFLLSCLKACRAAGIHTALDTSGYADGELFQELIANVDLFLFDLKQVDPERHRQYTGVDNSGILANLQRTCEAGKPVWVRIPIIPGYTDSEENLHQIAGLLKDHGNVEQVSLLPYNAAAGAKYEAIGRKYALAHLASHQNDEPERLTGYFHRLGIRTVIGR